jgi:hypothetical protein
MILFILRSEPSTNEHLMALMRFRVSVNVACCSVGGNKLLLGFLLTQVIRFDFIGTSTGEK